MYTASMWRVPEYCCLEALNEILAIYETINTACSNCFYIFREIKRICMIAAPANLNRYSDEELIALLTANDEKWFNYIYDKYHQRVHQVAMRYLKSDANSNEVVQEVFMQLWLERNNMKTATPIEGWLCTVAKNITINRLKKMLLNGGLLIN